MPHLRARLEEHLAKGHHAGMEWLAEKTDWRADPRALWPDVKSIIMLGTSYAPATNPMATLAQSEIGTISVYARMRDYHDVIKGRLKQIAGFLAKQAGADVKVFVDTAPVMEKPLAAAAGLVPVSAACSTDVEPGPTTLMVARGRVRAAAVNASAASRSSTMARTASGATIP